MSYLLSAWDNEGRINTALVQEPAHLNNPTPASTQLTRSIYIYIYISGGLQPNIVSQPSYKS